jgi:DNA-binding Lrp family transcriptional regulator
MHEKTPYWQKHAAAPELDLLTEEDLELINALQIAPRVTWQDAGAILGVRPATLAARWERIEADGLAWITAYGVGDSTEMTLAFVDVDCTPGEVMAVADALNGIPEVQTVELPASHHDAMLTVFTRSLYDYANVVAPRILAIPGVERIHTALGGRLHQAGHSWRIPALDARRSAAFAELAVHPRHPGALTPACRDLMPLLAQDGRATAAQMAKDLGRHPSTVQRQLARLLGSGLIAFRCDVAQLAVGFPVICTWYAKVPSGQHAAAAAGIRSLRSVRLAASITGRANFIVTMWLRSVADVVSAELAMAEKVPGIEFMESIIVLRVTKRMGVLIGPDGRAQGRVALPREAMPAGLD